MGAGVAYFETHTETFSLLEAEQTVRHIGVGLSVIGEEAIELGQDAINASIDWVADWFS